MWKARPFDELHAWIWIIGHANYQREKHEFRGQLVTIERGQLVTSIDALAYEWGWDRKKVMRYTNKLKKEQMIEKSGTTYGTLITVVNYDKWQGRGTDNGTADGTPNGTADETHYKNNKEYIRTQKNARAREEGPATKKWNELKRKEAEKHDAGGH